jgi:DNA-binding LytR/AlgR family response regulator
MTLSCLIADDEPLAHHLLENYIGRLKTLHVAGHAYNGMEVLDFLSDHDVDILFLDIQMPELSGLDMLKTLSNPPVVILTTAYSEYSLEAFDLGVTDYLLKPIKFERFLTAVNRVIGLRKGQLIQSPSIPDTIHSGSEHFFVKDGHIEHKIRFQDIQYVQAYGNYVKIHTPSATFTGAMTMKQLDELLPVADFVRIHKSYIIRLDRVTQFTGQTVFTADAELPVGMLYRLVLEQRLKN